MLRTSVIALSVGALIGFGAVNANAAQPGDKPPPPIKQISFTAVKVALPNTVAVMGILPQPTNPPKGPNANPPPKPGLLALAGGATPGVYTYAYDGKGGFAQKQFLPLVAGALIGPSSDHNLGMVDVDNDNLQDIVVTYNVPGTSGSSTVTSIFKANKDGSFQTTRVDVSVAITTPLNMGSPSGGFWFNDFNGDKKVDMVELLGDGSGFAVLLNTSK